MQKQKRKICAFTSSRADFSKIETVLRAIQKHPKLELKLGVLGSHLLDKTGRTVNDIRRKGFPVDFELQMEVDGGNPASMAKSVGLAIIELTSVIGHFKPDVVIAPTDRFETLAIGVAAALMNIRVAHVEGGEVTGTIDESIRHAITKLAHMHFVATPGSRERVIKMGEVPDNVWNVGSAGVDLLLEAPKWSRVRTLRELNKLITERKGNKSVDATQPYLLIAQHPVTTEFGNGAAQITETMEAVKDFDGQLIMLWPNIDAGADDISKVLRHYVTHPRYGKKISIFKHLPTDLFINLMRNASCAVGNSSSIVRETCYFGTPAIHVGTRQSGRERGKNVSDALHDRKEIGKLLSAQLAHGFYPIERVYGDGSAGEKMAEILATVKLPAIQKRITY